MPGLNYKYWFTQIADYDVGMIVTFKEMFQMLCCRVKEWNDTVGSSCQMLIPSLKGYELSCTGRTCACKAGYDPLIKL